MKRLLVAGLIIVKGRVLMLHNVKYGLRVEPPGGKVYDGEAHEDALIREICEELDVKAGNLRLFGAYETRSAEGDFLVQTFLCDIIDGTVRNAEPEKFERIGWYTFEELVEFKNMGVLAPNIANALDELKDVFS